MVRIALDRNETSFSLTDVALKDLSISGLNTVLRYANGRAIGTVTIVFQERLKIAWARSNSPTSKFPFGYQHIAESLIMTKLLCHLCGSGLHTLLVVFASHEDVKGLVRPRDDAFPVCLVPFWVLELLFLGVGISWIRVVNLTTHVF